MSDYGHYVTYRNNADEIRERVERTQRTRPPGRSRRRSGRHALARRLHALADRLGG